MRQTQKRLHTRTMFKYGETELTYAFEHVGSIQERVVDYLEVSRSTSRCHTAVRDWSRLQLGALLIIAGILAIVAQTRLVGFDPLAMLWLMPGCIYLALFTFRQGHFLVLQGAGEPLWVIDDASRHSIVAELDRRRRERLHDIYGQLNLANEAYLEIRKIQWLVEESILTRDQADDQIRIVNGVAIARAEASDLSRAAGAGGLFERESIAV
jgi:hypothetical protein